MSNLSKTWPEIQTHLTATSCITVIGSFNWKWFKQTAIFVLTLKSCYASSFLGITVEIAIGSEQRGRNGLSVVASAQAAVQDSRGEIKVKYRSTGRGKQQNTAASESGLLFSEWIMLMDGPRESLRLQVISSETLARCFLKKHSARGIQGLYLQKKQWSILLRQVDITQYVYMQLFL